MPSITLTITQQQADQLKNGKPITIETEIKKVGGWKPDIKSMYFFITEYGDVDEETWDDHEVDLYRYNTLNVFKTEKEAEQDLKTGFHAKILAYGKITRWIQEQGYWFEPDYDDTNQERFFILYDTKKKEYYFTRDTHTILGGLSHCFSDLKHILHCIKDCKSELDILFGIGGEK